jgi:CDP-diacylglycerol--serine O-phosphatidyltransferase
MYQVEFAAGSSIGGTGGASWTFCYFYVMAAAIRLARFNVTQAGRPKTHFIGLPSPAAGMTLATFYPFTQTSLYASMHALPWHLLLTFLMIALTILMVSNVHYPTLPRAGFRSASGLLGLTVILVILVFGIWKHDSFVFPLGIVYMTYGVGRAILLGFFKAPAEDEEAEIAGPIVIDETESSFRRPGTGAGGAA